MHETGICIYATHDTQAAVRLGDEQRPFSGQNVVRRVFRTFGHTFRRLTVHMHSLNGLDDIREIDRCIRAYSRDTLHEMVFHNVRQELLIAWRRSLETVTSVVLAGGRVNKFTTSLSTFLPQLTKLSIEVESTMHLDCVAGDFPHLREFAVSVSLRYESTADVLSLLRRNPQVRTVRISMFGDTAFLRAVNNYLPHLKSFEVMTHLFSLYDLDRSGKLIRFENVTDLKVTIGDRDHGGFSTRNRSALVRFDRLESIELTPLGDGLVDSLIELAGECKTLTKLRLNWSVMHRHLQRIVDLLPVLTEITVEFNSILVFDEIRPFFSAETKLKRLIVIFRTFAWNRDDIQQALPAKWSFIERSTDAFRITLIFFQAESLRGPTNQSKNCG